MKNINGKQENCEVKHAVKKAVYYTRTTHLIQEFLPLRFTCWDEGGITNEQRTALESFMKIPIDLFYIYSLTTASASQEVQGIVRQFFLDSVAEILIFVADMKVISVDVINHTRIMLGEIEHMHSKKLGCNKLVLLLLHFPSDLNSRMCYPAIFLHDWDHYYLDSIGRKEDIGGVNIVSWLSQCCFDSPHLVTEYPFVTEKTLCSWINELMPMICAHIKIKELSNWPSNLDASNLSRLDIWKTFLVCNGVGDVLIKRFLTYWTPKKMSDTSNKASVISKTSSSFGMTGIIEAEVHQAFTDYLLYTLSYINKQHGLHILNSCDSYKSKDFFLKLLAEIPLPPKLEHFKAALLNYKRKKTNETAHSRALTFPFFRIIFDLLECILDLAVNEFYDKFVKKNEEDQNQEESDEITANAVESAFDQPNMISCIITLMLQRVQKEVCIYSLVLK